MKTIWKPIALLMAAILMLTALTACAGPEQKILGKWMDSSNMSGYDFQEEGIVELTYANFTVPVVNIPFTGTVKGTYSLGEDNTLTITYSIYSKSITKTYTYSIEDSALTLVEKESGDRAIYIRQADSTN
uniref:hypothetical protein n=1 Tax=Candidatus Fimivicinus sp. TaxID=3056640 RepID=UPI003FEEE783